MNARVKRKWIAALRSGKYEQGQGWLMNGEKYCCLGVLCDVFEKEKKQKMWIHREWGQVNVRVFMGNTHYLPPIVVKWAELDSSNPMIGGVLAENLNDRDNRSFKYIADEIEKYL